jgi:hypothetical protein
MLNYKIKFQFIVIILLVSLQSSLAQQSKKQPVDYVDNFIGVRDVNTSTILNGR